LPSGAARLAAPTPVRPLRLVLFAVPGHNPAAARSPCAPSRKEAGDMGRLGKTAVVGFFVVAFALGSYAYFRAVYSHGKRLRVVEPGRFYRSGQLTAAGFRDAVGRYG